MWYRFAAYGTIDLQKYIPEKLGEDFDVDSEVPNLLSSSMVNNKLDFNLLNEKLSTSPLSSLISEFRPTYHLTHDALLHFDTKVVELSTRSSLENLIQSLKHELRHVVDKGRGYRPEWLNGIFIDILSSFFNKNKDIIIDEDTSTVSFFKLLYKAVFTYWYENSPKFKELSDGQQSEKIVDILFYMKRKDLIKDVFQRLINGEKVNNIKDYYYVNNPGEYVTHLSDINDQFSPEALNSFAQRNNIDDEIFINMMKDVISKLNANSDFSLLRYINSRGADLIETILEHSENPQMIRNVYKILSDNFQKYISQYAYSSDQFKEAKKDYNAPRTGKKKKRWSVKYKKSIDCNSPKGFSQINYCKRKRSGGKYKTEG
jgi:hypothetical protein